MDTNREETAKTEETKEAEIINIETERETDEKVKVEEFKISGDVLVGKVKELIRQGNIRRIILKNESGQTLIEIPMTVGVIGSVISAALFPVIAAVGVIGAMVARLTVVIERIESGQ
ncbi:MAG: DUF4342 domain-containing protein [Xenococcaceae cyanobacterium]